MRGDSSNIILEILHFTPSSFLIKDKLSRFALAEQPARTPSALLLDSEVIIPDYTVPPVVPYLSEYEE